MKIISVIEYFNRVDRSNRWGAPQQERSVDRALYKKRWGVATRLMEIG
jgi:hypothetical protein